MKKREMKITIGKDGKVGIEVEGVPGADCLDFSRFLEEELGTVVNREKTGEYFEEVTDKRLSVSLSDGEEKDEE